jgi:hypothetical protein
MTTTERNAVSSPETGALVWNTTTSAINQYNGSAWSAVDTSTDNTKLPLAGGAMTGAITTNSTFDGRDVAADGVLATNALPKAGGAMTGTITNFRSTGIDDNADGALAITIDSSEKINIHQGRLQLGHVNKFIDTTNYVGDMINIAYHPYSAGINLGKSYPADNPTTVVKGLEVHNERIVLYYTGGANSPTEKVRVDTDGLKFNGDTASANALDDYEEGTWTPANQWITITNEVQARYVKIGNMVTVWGNITWASSPSDVSQTGGKIQGLPFTPLGGDHPFLGSWWGNVSTGSRKPDNYDFYVNASTTLIIYNRTSSRVAQRQQMNNSHLKFQATYQVA